MDGYENYYPSWHTQGKFTNICVGYSQFFLTNPIGKYYFYIYVTLTMKHQSKWIAGGGI